MIRGMVRYRTAGEAQAEFLALRRALDHAGRALGCAFSSADEFEAEVIRVRREEGALPPPRPRRMPWLLAAVLAAALASALFLL